MFSKRYTNYQVGITILMCLLNVDEIYPTGKGESLDRYNSTNATLAPSGDTINGTVACNRSHSCAGNDSIVYGQNEGPIPRISTMTVNIIGAFCNTLLIITILMDPLNLLRRGAWFTILNLAVADFIASIASFLKIGLHVEFGTPHGMALEASRFFWMFGASASFMLLTVLTVETYVTVKYPIRSRTMLTRTRSVMFCLVIWLVAIPIGLSKISHLIIKSVPKVIKVHIAIIAVLELAVTIQVILKTLIIREIFKSRRNTEVTVEQNSKKHKEIAKTIIMLNVILITTAFPYFVANQVDYLWRLSVIPHESSRLFRYYFEPIAVVNFAANPILYSLRLPDYRRSLFTVFCRCRHKHNLSRGFSSVRTKTMRSTSFLQTPEQATSDF